MKRLALMSLLSIFLLCSACGKQAEPAELSRVVYARGHGSTWGNQFRMEVCPTEISYAHFFEKTNDGQEFKEFYAVPIEEMQWKEIETAVLAVLPQLEIQKPPSLVQRLVQALGPKTVDGGKWTKLTVTWLADSEPKDVQYIWANTAEAEAFEHLLQELAQTLNK